VLGLASSTVSAHLKELRQAGLIDERKEGRWVHIGLTSDGVARAVVDAALAALETDPQLAEDAVFVEELRRLPVEALCSLGYEGARAALHETSDTDG
jgi:DNA-binding transcriptional ArsR family regulator